jgi:hypothetical protein
MISVALRRRPHSLIEAFNNLTNNEDRGSSFHMRVLFWLFPPILIMGKKGKIMRSVKRTLGKIGALMWRDAKIVGVTENNTLLAHMCKAFISCTVRQT